MQAPMLKTARSWGTAAVDLIDSVDDVAVDQHESDGGGILQR